MWMWKMLFFFFGVLRPKELRRCWSASQCVRKGSDGRFWCLRMGMGVTIERDHEQRCDGSTA